MDQLIQQLREMMITLKGWQGLIGSMIGAMSPFLLWWFAENHREKKCTMKSYII
ncbi:MAG: hypothetical protein WCW31_01855 [Patescibacteria group bacterium]|jgi:hypothetical protein